jgi:hypothetical protein
MSWVGTCRQPARMKPPGRRGSARPDCRGTRVKWPLYDYSVFRLCVKLVQIYVAAIITCTNGLNEIYCLCRSPSAEAEAERAVSALRAAVLRKIHIIFPLISGRLGDILRESPNFADMPANRRDTISRAYKACLSCRKRKIRCNLGPSNQAPCQRCQRESRECIIPEERSWKKQHETPRGGPSRNSGLEVSHTGHHGASPSYLTSAVASRAQEDGYLEAETRSTSAPARTSNADLENTIVTTTVTNGNDALGLLFSDIRSGQTTAAAEPANGVGPVSTSVEEPMAAQSHRPSFATPGELHPTRVSDKVKKAWSSSKLGQMGWLRAHEVTSLLDS